MDALATLIVIAVVCAVFIAGWRSLSKPNAAPDGFHCMSCGSNTGDPRQTSPLAAVAVILWIIAIVAAFTVSWLCIVIGLVGHVMADRARRTVCPTCGHENLVPAHTPAAVAHANQLLSDRMTRN
jgi:hypothetical protein